MAKRTTRRASWGSVHEVSPGVWRIRYWAEGPDGYRRRSCTVRGTRRDAELRRSELMLAHSSDAPCPTVGQVWERWYLPALRRRESEGDLSRRSLVNFESAWRAHAGPRWGSVPCDAVRPLEVQQWLDGCSRNGAVRALEVLRPMLDYAVRYGVVATNPFRERYLLPSAATIARHDAGVWSLAELGEVWRSLRGEWFEAAFLLAGFGGLRVGEALGVRGSDVSALEVAGTTLAMVAVERQMPNRGKDPVDRLKTPQSRRVVPVCGRAGLALLDMAAGSDWLSGDGCGGPNTQPRLVRSWAAAPLAEGLRHPFRNLRNSWQTWMRWELRVPVWAIEPMMGHKVAGVTGAHYDRPSAQLFAEVLAEAYAARPFDAGWDYLGPRDGIR